jgi:hypothetical protein
MVFRVNNTLVVLTMIPTDKNSEVFVCKLHIIWQSIKDSEQLVLSSRIAVFDESNKDVEYRLLQKRCTNFDWSCRAGLFIPDTALKNRNPLEVSGKLVVAITTV